MSPHFSSRVPSVSVILNVFRRSQNFHFQLEAIKKQTWPVKEIFVWENGEDTIPEAIIFSEGLTRLRSSRNLGVWSRFALALNATGDLVWLIDDDVVPGVRWLENAVNTYLVEPAVIGSRGLKFHSNFSYLLYDEFGPNAPSFQAEVVDIVGHNWIFPRAWLGLFWGSYQEKFDSPLAGEDIHLSFVAKRAGYPTVVPPHPPDSLDLWGEIKEASLFSGDDTAAISKDLSSLRRFEDAFRHYVSLGFQTVSSQDHVTFGRKTFAAVLGKLISRFPKQFFLMAKKLGLRKSPGRE